MSVLAHKSQVLSSYRTLLRTIRYVFRHDLPMMTAGSYEARVTFERFRNETDPEKLTYLLSEAQVASDVLYRELVEINFDKEKDKHIARVQERHLKYDDGTHVHEKKFQ